MLINKSFMHEILYFSASVAIFAHISDLSTSISLLLKNILKPIANLRKIYLPLTNQIILG
jgi:hypothetical protein